MPKNRHSSVNLTGLDFTDRRIPQMRDTRFAINAIRAAFALMLAAVLASEPTLGAAGTAIAAGTLIIGLMRLPAPPPPKRRRREAAKTEATAHGLPTAYAARRTGTRTLNRSDS